MKADQVYGQYSEDQKFIKNGLNKYSRIGFWLSLLSLLISLKGIISLLLLLYPL